MIGMPNTPNKGWTATLSDSQEKRFKNIEAREEDNFTQIMHLKERVRKLDRWFNIFIVVNLVIAALYLIT